MGVERENAREAFRLIRKEPPRHVSLVLGLYALSCKEKELGKVARSSYFFFRHMDDLLDGDMKYKENPLSYALGIREQIESGNFTGKPSVVDLAKYSISTLESRGNKEDNPRQDFLTSIDSIIFDYERSQQRRILNKSELDEYYWKTFSPVVNILLIGLKSKLRAKDIPALSMTQGRLYTIRDLETDWTRGTINIPQEVVDLASLSSEASFREVKQNPIIQKWFREEALECKNELLELQNLLKNNGEGLTSAICNRLIKWMINFADNQIQSKQN